MNGLCSHERLERALAGLLNADDESTLYSHLDECELCSAEMERLSGGEQASDEIASMLIPDDLDDALPLHEECSTADFVVDHLEPSDDPAVLGRLGGYDVLDVIGRGGMGVVLKGFDRELKRFVAIKALAPHLAHSALARKRFAREAQAAAAVVNLHVIAIHQVQPNGQLPFLVMPLLTGESLAQRLTARGTLELTEILRIGMQAAEGLAAAHGQGLIHRDVKPANILLEKGVERAVLTDFGLARAADDVSMTRWGIIAGTPEYMSPEQARGEALDGRSDLFSLGCVLYEMATGVSPFRTDSTMATLRRIVDEQPAAMASLVPELPPWFCHIVERLLSKDPAQRFASASEVSQLLEQCLSHLQQPTSVPLPASLVPHATGRRSIFNVTWKRVTAIAMLGVFGLSFLGMVLLREETTPPNDKDATKQSSVPVPPIESRSAVAAARHALLVSERDKHKHPVESTASGTLSDSPEGSKSRPQPPDRETKKDVPRAESNNNHGTLTQTQPHEARIPVRAKLLVVKRDWSNADEKKPQDGIRKSLSELPDTPVSRAARVRFADAGLLGPDDLVSNLGLPSVFGAEDFASLQSWLRDQGLLLGELPVEQQATPQSEDRWASQIDLSAADVVGVIGKWSMSVDTQPASIHPDEQGIIRVVNHPYLLAFIHISRTQQVMESQPGGPRLRGASLSKKPKFSFYLPKKRVIAIDWDAPFTGKASQLNQAHGSKVILVFEDAEVPEPRSTVAGFRLPERIGSLYLDDERRWLSPPDDLGDIDRAVATARPEPATDANDAAAAKHPPIESRSTVNAARQALLVSQRDMHPPFEFRIAASKADREADGVAWFPIVKPRIPAPAGKSGANLPIEEKLEDKWRGRLWNKLEHTLLSDGTWSVVKCDVVQSAQSTDLVPSFDIQVKLDVVGGALLRRLTATHLNQSIAIVVEGTIVAAPIIRSEFGEDFVITGNFSKAAAEKLAAAVRKPDPRKRATFGLRFADAKSALAAVKEEAVRRKLRGFEVTLDPQLNTIAITAADADTLAALQEILGQLDTPVGAPKPESNTLSKLAGVWIAEKVTSSDEVVPKEKFPFELHFENDKLIFRFVAPSLGKDRVNEIVVDETKTPATIDIRSTDPRRKETVYAIFKLEGDRLLIHSFRDSNGQPSEKRPTTFDSSKGERSDLLVLTRKPVPQK